MKGVLLDEESITVSTSAVGFTTGTAFPAANPANYAFVEVETAAIRFWATGTDPTASVGHIAEPGDVIELESEDQCRKFRAIRRDAADAILRVSYGRQ